MREADPVRLAGAKTRVRDGLRSHAVAAASSRRAVQLADGLAGVHEELGETELAAVTEGQDVSDAVERIDTDRLHGLRKVSEVIEDDLGVGVGHSKFARAAGIASTFTSLGAFVIAGHNVLVAATALDTAHEKAGSVSAINMPRFFDFYRALAIFIAEGILFWTPVNFKVAWRGTRYLNNRVLYRFRGVHNGLYKLLLSEVHYAIRGIGPKALREPDAVATYLTSMVMQSVELLREFEDINPFDFLDSAKEIAREFKRFVETTYDITTGAVDLAAIAEEALSEITKNSDSRIMPSPTAGY